MLSIRLRQVAGCIVGLSMFACGGSSSTKTTASTPPSSTSSSATTTTAANAQVDSAATSDITVKIGDLPSGWTQVQAGAIPDPSLNAPGFCAGVDVPLTGTRSAGAFSEFSFHLQPNGGEEGHLLSGVVAQATTSDVDKTIQRLQSPAYPTCLSNDAVSTLQRAGTSPGTPQVGTRTLPNSNPGVAVRVTISYTFGGVERVMFTDYFDYVVGRAEVRVSMQKCCAPFDDASETAIIEAVDQRATHSALA